MISETTQQIPLRKSSTQTSKESEHRNLSVLKQNPKTKIKINQHFYKSSKEMKSHLPSQQEQEQSQTQQCRNNDEQKSLKD